MTQPPDRIDSVEALVAAIGKAPSGIDLKVIDHLDDHALRWIAASPLAFAGFGYGNDIAITLAGGDAGFASATATKLHLPLSRIDRPDLVRTGQGFGSLFLLPGIGETLRVNGCVASVADGQVSILVEECYVHCAKALIRSGFWTAAPGEGAVMSLEDFAANCGFMAFATIDPQGRADLSPKGDPAGHMTQLDGDRLWFAERPGNRRADSLRNIISQPNVAALLMIPGSRQVAIIKGNAMISTEESVRERFAIRGKTPALATSIDLGEVFIQESPSLARADLWPVAARPDGIDPAKIFVAHVKLNRGLQARLAGAIMSIPGLMQKGLDKDYETNLY